MIYITEMAFAHPDRLAEWHEFNRRNTINLQTCPGFMASQRFEAVTETIAPFTAIHEVESPEVFLTPTYVRQGGRQSNGEWQLLMTHWHRNLYSGLDVTPAVPESAHLVYFDAPRAVVEKEMPLPLDTQVHWLCLAGLDRTIPHRAIAVVDDASQQIEAAKRDPRIKVFRPITPRLSTGRPLS